MPPARPSAKARLRERNLPRPRAVFAGKLFGVQPWLLAIGTLLVVGLLWFLYGWLTYPLVPLPLN